MRLFAKIFAAATVLLCASLSLFGYLLISASFRDGAEGEIDQALNQYQMMEYIVEAQIAQNDGAFPPVETFSAEMEKKSRELVSPPDRVGVYSQEGEALYSDFPAEFHPDAMGQAEEGSLLYQTVTFGEEILLVVTGRIRCGDALLYFAAGRSLRGILEQKERMELRFRQIYCLVCLAATLAAAGFAVLLVLPVRRMTKSAARIAAGKYGVRVPVTSKDELGLLAESFNRMAQAVEESVEELKETAQRKEDFVANFAHELKTPLTSVVGYADMICSREMSKEEIRQAAGYIRDEGQRLEELSLKLMEMIVLDRQSFVLEELPAEEVLSHVTEGIAPIWKEKQVQIRLQAEAAYIAVELDLFKTLLLNLLDNAVKADANRILLTGRVEGETYVIHVEDNGRGIPRQDLPRITEEFYMVDKSRSRKQHGAGLGLALAVRIADVHHAKISFESEEGVGTQIRITMPCVPSDVRMGADETGTAGNGGCRGGGE